MKINKMTATFGKLENETLVLKDGLNVFVRPSETGKSTWCAFIRDMLYGIDPNEKGRKNYIPDKVIFKPWSGKQMQGSMLITNENDKILITRQTDDPNKPLNSFKAVYDRNQEEVPGFNGDNCGERLMGVSKSVFTRSAFVRQGSIEFENSPDLEKRILSLISSGEEGISYTEADTRLRSWQRKRRFSTKGKLPELENELSESVHKVDAIQMDVSTRDELFKHYKDSAEKCTLINEELKAYKENSKNEINKKLGEADAELKSATEKYNAIRSKAKADKATLNKNPLVGMDTEELKEQAAEDIKFAKKMNEKQKLRGNIAGTIIFALLTMASLVFGLVFRKYRIFLYPLTLIFFILAIYTEIRYIRKNGRAQHAYYERLKILNKYHVNDESEINDAVGEYITNKIRAKSSVAAEKEAAEQYKKCKNKKAELEKEIDDSDISELDSESAAALKIKLNEEILTRDKIKAELDEIETRIKDYGDPVVLRSNISRIRKQHHKMQEDYDAISIALDALRESDIDIENRYSSKINVMAAMYMSFMTDGKYDEVTFSKHEVNNIESDDLTSTSEYINEGTFDLLYLATRLAVCHFAMPDESKCPIILDDPLVNFDPEREKMAMKLLAEMAKTRQIIIFSTHELKV